MADVGILGVDDRVELIDGEIVEMNPIGSRHASSVGRLTRLFSELVGSKAFVWVQNPVRLSELSEPQPDLALLKPRGHFYADAHPSATDVLLLVEVSDSSLAFDRDVKLALYAAAGIPEVWIVDLSAGVLTTYTSPSGGQFADRRQFRGDDRVKPTQVPGVSLRAGDVF